MVEVLGFYMSHSRATRYNRETSPGETTRATPVYEVSRIVRVGDSVERPESIHRELKEI